MKPSKVDNLKAKRTWMLSSSFKGITWMGVVYCKKQEYIDQINKSDKIDSNFKSHETIHLRQAQSMKDSWFRFYMNYCWQWLKNLPLLTINSHAPYMLIPTEIEAYLNQNNWKYAEKNAPVHQWKEFQKLKLKEKREIAKKFFKSKEDKPFAVVLKEFFGSK